MVTVSLKAPFLSLGGWSRRIANSLKRWRNARMPEEPFNISADEIAHLLVRAYEIHEIIIAETSRFIGLRDAAMLHSAVPRPFATFGGEGLSILAIERDRRCAS